MLLPVLSFASLLTVVVAYPFAHGPYLGPAEDEERCREPFLFTSREPEILAGDIYVYNYQFEEEKQEGIFVPRWDHVNIPIAVRTATINLTDGTVALLKGDSVYVEAPQIPQQWSEIASGYELSFRAPNITILEHPSNGATVTFELGATPGYSLRLTQDGTLEGLSSYFVSLQTDRAYMSYQIFESSEDINHTTATKDMVATVDLTSGETRIRSRFRSHLSGLLGQPVAIYNDLEVAQFRSEYGIKNGNGVCHSFVSYSQTGIQEVKLPINFRRYNLETPSSSHLTFFVAENSVDWVADDEGSFPPKDVVASFSIKEVSVLNGTILRTVELNFDDIQEIARIAMSSSAPGFYRLCDLAMALAVTLTTCSWLLV